MKVYSVLHGGLGDMLLQMYTPGRPFGRLADAKARGYETAAVVESDRRCARELVAGAPFLDHIVPKIPQGFQYADSVRPRLAWAEYQHAFADAERATIESIHRPYVAVHLGSDGYEKRPPDPKLLLGMLQAAHVPHVVVGHDSEGPPPSLWTHIEVVRRAAKFIGTLSCFNCVAQLAKVPSFVLLNRAIKEPIIFGRMRDNGAIGEEWNVGRPVTDIYRQAVAWAAS